MKKVLLIVVMVLALGVLLNGCGVEYLTLEDVGFRESDLKLDSGDHIEEKIDNQEEKRSGDFYLYSSASYEEVQKAVYDACKKVADDGEVRDFMTEDPMEFAPSDAEIVWFGYTYNGAFRHVAVSVYTAATEAAEAAETTAPTEATTTQETTASTEVQTTQETTASTEAASEPDAGTATEAQTDADAGRSIYLLQWD